MPGEFDEVIPRANTDSVKHDDLLRRFGRADLQPLWVADMDFRAPACVQKALGAAVDHGVYGYVLTGERPRRAICDWFARRHGTRVEPASITFTPGVVSALSCLVQALTRPGDTIVVQPPVYPPFFSVIRDNGRGIAESPLVEQDNRYTVDFDDLEAKARGARALILCSPHNPVGRVWRRQELERMAEICLRHGLLIISDEIHNDLVYPPAAHLPTAALGPEVERITVTCHAPSKTFNLPALSTAYVIIPNPELRAAFQRFVGRLHLEGPNLFGLRALEAAYAEGEPWRGRLLDYLAGNAALVRRHAEAHLPALRLSPLEGTYLLWLDFRRYGLAPDALRALLLERAGLALNDGRSFGTGGAGFQRLNIACPRASLARALDRLTLALPA